jgi:hypothetical protein
MFAGKTGDLAANRESARSVGRLPDMKQAMALASHFLLVPLCVLVCLPLACSSTDDGTTKAPPAPPGGGSSSGGSAAGGSGGMATGGSGGMSGGASTGMACTKTPDCPAGGFFCKEGMCSCSADKPDICGTGATAACVSKPTDPANCGECGKMCDAGAACVAGTCSAKPAEVTTATGCGGGVRMVIQGSDLYWTEKTTGKVRTVPLAGGTVKDVATGQLSPTQIAADATGLYWAVQGDTTAASSKVMKVVLPLAATPAPVALKTATAMDKLVAIAVHGAKLYYSLKTDVHQISTDEKVTADVVVGTSINYDDPANPVILGDPKGLAVNDTVVVWATPGDRNAVEAHTLTPVTDVKDQTGYAKLGKSIGALLPSGDVGIDAKYGYWVDGEKFARNTIDAKEAIPETITTAPDSKKITAFAINAMNVYASAEDGRLFKHSLTPPTDPNDEKTIVPAVPFARDQMEVSSIVVDGTKVYWVTSDCMIRSSAL